ncbi:MAG TPA: hypothetical protein PK358_13410 [Spirochaetota bacterium]|nr:hypothetical protein [Spirochaetota bacterium]HPJ35829.1 hypothetical protein [Spirochaetota bacterium]
MKKRLISETKEDDEEMNPLLAGIPMKSENKEPWRKARYSCSGAGRIPGNFDTWHLASLSND